MNHLKHYIRLCQRAKNRTLDCQIEKHHVFPKFMFGDNDFTVELSLREHFIAHILLIKIIEKRYGRNNSNFGKAVKSFCYMLHQGKGGSRNYEKIRILHSVLVSEYMTFNNPMKNEESRKKVGEKAKGRKAWNKGLPRTAEEKAKMSAARLGKPCFKRRGQKRSEETKAKMRAAAKNRKPVSEETRRKQREAHARRKVGASTQFPKA